MFVTSDPPAPPPQSVLEECLELRPCSPSDGSQHWGGQSSVWGTQLEAMSDSGPAALVTKQDVVAMLPDGFLTGKS